MDEWTMPWPRACADQSHKSMPLPPPQPSWPTIAAAGRARAALLPSSRELRVDLAILVAFAICAAALVQTGGGAGDWSWRDALILGVVYAFASRIELDAGAGYTVPTQVVLVIMLLLLAPAFVPLLIAVALVAAEVPSAVRGEVHPARLIICAGDAVHALAPAAVLVAGGAGVVSLEQWPLYLAALAAQFAVDAATAVGREWLRLGVAPWAHLRALRFVYVIDLLLAPIGLLAAYAGGQVDGAYILVLPMLAIVAVMARERSARFAGLVALQTARVEALTDPLTRLLNRRGWEQAAQRLIDDAVRASSELAIAVIDLDHFKAYNDAHGHPAGDALLLRAAAQWSALVRPADVLARHGGEEFALALPGAGVREAHRACERLRQAMPDHTTCSIGVVCVDPRDGLAAAVRRADRALYEAKRAGRDRVVVAADGPELAFGA